MSSTTTTSPGGKQEQRPAAVPLVSSLDQRTTPGRNSFAVADVTAHRIKSELTWYQLVHAEIIGMKEIEWHWEFVLYICVYSLRTDLVVAVTSAMRKNARWSGMNVNGLNMGGLGMSMGLRKGHGGNSELHSRNQVSERSIILYRTEWLILALISIKGESINGWVCQLERVSKYCSR